MFSLCFSGNGSKVFMRENRGEEGTCYVVFSEKMKREVHGGRSIGFFWISHCLGSEKAMLFVTVVLCIKLPFSFGEFWKKRKTVVLFFPLFPFFFSAAKRGLRNLVICFSLTQCTPLILISS